MWWFFFKLQVRAAKTKNDICILQVPYQCSGLAAYIILAFPGGNSPDPGNCRKALVTLADRKETKLMYYILI